MFSNSDSGHWALTPELQKKFEEVQAHTRRLQAELGIKPMTLDERAAAYEQRRQEQHRQQEELKKLQEQISKHRPPPKWKV